METTKGACLHQRCHCSPGDFVLLASDCNCWTDKKNTFINFWTKYIKFSLKTRFLSIFTWDTYKGSCEQRQHFKYQRRTSCHWGYFSSSHLQIDSSKCIKDMTLHPTEDWLLCLEVDVHCQVDQHRQDEHMRSNILKSRKNCGWRFCIHAKVFNFMIMKRLNIWIYA